MVSTKRRNKRRADTSIDTEEHGVLLDNATAMEASEAEALALEDLDDAATDDAASDAEPTLGTPSLPPSLCPTIHTRLCSHVMQKDLIRITERRTRFFLLASLSSPHASHPNDQLRHGTGSASTEAKKPHISHQCLSHTNRT